MRERKKRVLMEKKQSETGANRTERGNMAGGTPGVGGN